MTTRSHSGFTLIEILVATTILGILMAIVTISFQAANRNARDTRRQADLEEIRGAVERYRLQESTYPGDTGERDSSADGVFLFEMQPDYLQKNYTDPYPAGGASHYYEYRNVGAEACNYVLIAKMEVAGHVKACPTNCGVTHAANDYDYCISD